MTRPAVTQGASNAEGAASHGRNKYEDIATKAVGMTESIKHAIVLLQIAKVSFEVNKKGSFEKVRTDVLVSECSRTSYGFNSSNQGPSPWNPSQVRHLLVCNRQSPTQRGEQRGM